MKRNPCKKSSEGIYRLLVEHRFDNFVGMHQVPMIIDRQSNAGDSLQCHRLRNMLGINECDSSHFRTKNQLHVIVEIDLKWRRGLALNRTTSSTLENHLNDAIAQMHRNRLLSSEPDVKMRNSWQHSRIAGSSNIFYVPQVQLHVLIVFR